MSLHLTSLIDSIRSQRVPHVRDSLEYFSLWRLSGVKQYASRWVLKSMYLPDSNHDETPSTIKASSKLKWLVRWTKHSSKFTPRRQKCPSFHIRWKTKRRNLLSRSLKMRTYTWLATSSGASVSPSEGAARWNLRIFGHVFALLQASVLECVKPA